MFWESAVEENNEIIMDASYHMQCNSPSAGLGKLGSLNISNPGNSTLQDMSADHLSFYDDEEARTLALQQSQNNHLWHTDELLLPEEGPAERFRVVEKSKCFQRKSLQRLQDATNSQHKTPPRGGGFRVFNSLSSCSMESSIDDDEYLELFEMESLEEQLQQENQTSLALPSNLNSLISGQIKSALTRTPEMRRPSVRRCLSLTDNHNEHQQQQKQLQLILPKTPEQLQKNTDEICTTPLYSSKLATIEHCNSSNVSPFSVFCFKRPDPPSVTTSPIQTKRYRGDEKENFDFQLANVAAVVPTTSKSTSLSTRVPYRKSMSMNDAEIMSALARSDSFGEPDLIGDFSKPFVLPLIEGQHRDLKTISSDTVARLINGEFNNKVANYVIVDCRYPYEYEGGHIRGAKNLYTQEQITEEFLTQQKTEQHQARNEAAGTKRNIIIFHCEFSSKRGPRLSRFLRNIDRARNTNSYPTLDYPEIYLLHNGYKEFYETHGELCDPIAYRPMLEPAYSDAYRHFRAKSKSWNGDGDGIGGTTSRLKKSRSRLML